jgi:hypothetical protein
MGHLRTVIIAFSLLLYTLATCQAARAATGTIKEIKTGTAASPRVEIVTDQPPTEMTCYTMPQLRRAVVDLYGIEPGQAVPAVPPDTSLIRRITVQRKTINERVLSRVIIELAKDADVSIIIELAKDADVSITPQTLDRNRIFVALKPAPAATTPSAPKTDSKAPAAKPAQIPQPAPAAKAAAKTPLQPVVPDLGPAPIISAVKAGRDGVEIVAQTSIERFTTFTLTDPGRLVIDIAKGGTTMPSSEVALNRFGVQKLRIGRYPDKLRLVFDAGTKEFPSHSLQKTGTGLRVIMTKGATGTRK